MKKLLLLTALLCGALCSSCVKEITSLDGTVWTNYRYNDGNWNMTQLIFTSTHATFIETNSADTDNKFTGTYTYNPPTVTISAAVSGETGMVVVDMTGTIKKKTMHIGIHQTADLVAMMDLKKQ